MRALCTIVWLPGFDCKYWYWIVKDGTSTTWQSIPGVCFRREVWLTSRTGRTKRRLCDTIVSWLGFERNGLSIEENIHSRGAQADYINRPARLSPSNHRSQIDCLKQLHLVRWDSLCVSFPRAVSNNLHLWLEGELCGYKKSNLIDYRTSNLSERETDIKYLRRLWFKPTGLVFTISVEG